MRTNLNDVVVAMAQYILMQEASLCTHRFNLKDKEINALVNVLIKKGYSKNDVVYAIKAAIDTLRKAHKHEQFASKVYIQQLLRNAI
jgi:predicted transcriptional regulator